MPRLLVTAFILTLLNGCVAVRPRDGFADVERALAARSKLNVHWSDGSDADRAVEAQVAALFAKPLSADAAVQIALLSNHHLQAVFEDLGVAQADLVEAGLLKNPIFDGSIRFVEGGGSPTIDLGVAFDFLDVFFVGLRRNIAAARLEAAQAAVTGAVLDLAGQTRIAFYEVQAAEQTLELQQQIERATAASYALATRLREAGNNRPLDVLNERALHEEATLARSSAETDLVQRREALNRLMGVADPQAAWTTAGRLPDPPADESLFDADLEPRAIGRSLDLRARRSSVDVALRRLGVDQTRAYLSDLEAGASAERDDGRWELGPAIRVPLPLFSQGQPAVARARSDLRRARQQYVATALEIRSAVRSAAALTRALGGQARRYRQTLLPLRAAIVGDTQLQYNAMQVGGFELLQAKRDEIEAGTQYVRLVRDYWIARARLELLLDGRLTPTMVLGDSVDEPDASRHPQPGH